MEIHPCLEWQESCREPDAHGGLATKVMASLGILLRPIGPQLIGPRRGALCVFRSSQT